MKTNNISFPHPVLRVKQGYIDENGKYDDSADDILPALDETSVSVKREEDTEGNYVYTITFKQEDGLITNLINGRKACYACEVSCASTFFRQCLRSDSKPTLENNNIFEIKIDRHKVRSTVEFNGYIALTSPFNYNNPKANQLYSHTLFPLVPGDIIAIFPTASDVLDVDKEEIYLGSAYMQIVEDEKAVYPTTSLTAQKIEIKLPSSMYKHFGKIQENFNAVIHASLVYNALVEALSNMGDPRYQSKLWAKCLQIRLASDDVKNVKMETAEDVHVIANIILQNPIKRMFDLLYSK